MDLDETVVLTGDRNGTFNSDCVKTLIEAADANTANHARFCEHSILSLNQTSNSYHLGDKFAEGAQGEILTGTDKVLKRFVAIKSLKKDFIGESAAVDSFVAEAITTAQLDHPSIIPIYGISSDEDSNLHMSLKLIHGQTLEELFEQARAECSDPAVEAHALNQRLEKFINICNAVAYAHEKNVLHRDLKPANIMVGSFYEVYVMDWGIAQPYREQDRHKDHDVVTGTPGYIAPEILRRRGPEPASDQFSLGIILYELISLRSALASTDINTRLLDTLAGKREKLKHYSSKITIHPDLKAICEKSCALDPADRYPSVSDLAEDIRRFIAKQEVVARPDNVVRKSFRLLASHRSIATVTVLSVLLISSAISIYSLVKQNIAAEQAKVREIKLLELRRSVEDRSHEIEMHFQKLSMILDRFADKSAFLLALEGVSQRERLKDYRVFKTPKTQPAGMLKSTLYNNWINLDYASYKLIAGEDDTITQQQLDAISPMVADAIYYEHEIGPDAHGVDPSSNLPGIYAPTSANARGINENLPISRIYLGLTTGLFIDYPANGMLADDYDPRMQKWYQAALGKPDVQWSSPSSDGLGAGTFITASTAISNKKGDFLGVAAFDMQLDDTQDSMVSQAETSELIASYLIDRDGNIIISSLKNVAGSPLAIPGLLQHINEQRSGGFEIDSNGRETTVDYAPIPTLGWYYIEQIDMKKYLNNTVQEQRNSAVKKL